MLAMSLHEKLNKMTTYKTFQKTIKGNVWNITVVEGKFNYVNIKKSTNNPFGIAGKDYANFDVAQEAYKCSELKYFILEVETGLIEQVKELAA
jgi:hypothetical protein